MKVIILFLFMSLTVFAVDNVEKDIEKLVNKNEYSKVISEYSKDDKSYSAKTLYFIGLSYYYSDDYNNAIIYFNKAIKRKNTSGDLYLRLANAYSYLNNTKKALEYFYIAKSKYTSKNNEYITIIYNIGLSEYLTGNYKKAEKSFEEIIKIKPEDYQTYAKLIQSYYAQKKYKNAEIYKEKLYEASKKGLLTGTLKDMFCFDQFKHKGLNIQVYERFQNDEGNKIYEKHIFFILNDKGDIDYKIQTEYSPIAFKKGGKKYLLCKSKPTYHATYDYGINSDFKYEDLKKAVIDIIDDKSVPAASSRYEK